MSAEASSSVRVAKDLTAGTVGGIAQVLVGQPFDIVKVRLQSSNAYSSALQCTTSILKNEGPLAFYKGTAMPLVGIGACVSLQFGCLEALKRLFGNINAREGREHMTIPQLYIAGAGAGIGNSIVSGPVEHIRIRLQTQPSGPNRLYHGPVDALRKIYATGGVRSIFAGQGITMLREAVGYGSYFAAYEWLVERECKKYKISRKEIPMSHSLLFGALAGYALWFTAYPLDVLKSRLQTDGLSRSSTEVTPFGQRKYRNFVDCARQLWREQGVKGFLRGLGPTLVRSPFANGATFAAFEVAMRALG
ncbi:mitochondrial carrier [Atractiella rhizophila]|nr:mitochondrial carrier [Atractiella rhizophila]